MTCSAQCQIHLLPQFSHQTCQSPPGSSWAWRAANVLPTEWLRFFASTRVLFFTAERVLIFGLLIIWLIICLRVPQLDVIILLDKTSSYSKCDWLPRMGFFCLWELRTSCKDFFSEELIFLVRSSKYKQNPVKEFPWMKITSQKRALSSINCRQTKVRKREPR